MRVRGAMRKSDPIPVIAHPELATLVDAPFDDDHWPFETKWDGFRAVVTVNGGGHVTTTSRSGKDLLARFPQLASIGSSFKGRPIIVDGEIVAIDDEGSDAGSERSSWASTIRVSMGRYGTAVE
jgi:bifunctional non-homologous end joining protein LigD